VIFFSISVLFYSPIHQIHSEGLNIFIPVIQYPIIYDLRITPSLHRTETASKDLQTVRLSVRILHQPDVTKLQQIYSEGLNRRT
jgi:regulator of protease activity HflC (stomatin/prohibitin superfamily)